jgi:hypothetical protein
MSGHALFAPSAAARWVRCPGSVALCNGLPDESSTFAEEGSVAHELAARVFSYHVYPAAHWLNEQIQLTEGGKWWTFTQEMCDYVQMYVDNVRACAKETNSIILCEHRVSLYATLGISEQGGTPDAILYSMADQTVGIKDLKYGRGERVEASYDGEPNYQLALYALGAIESITSLLGPVKRIRLSIVQPRLDHISEHEISYDELMAFGVRARTAAQAAMDALCTDPKPYLSPSAAACRWCKVKASCPAILAATEAEVASEFGVTKPIEIGKTLGERYAALPLIRQYILAVEEATFAAVSSGQHVIGSDGLPMKLVAGTPGHRKWGNQQLAGEVLMGMIGPAAYEPAEVISPAAADKLINKGKKQKTVMWDEAVKPLIKQPPGKPTLALGSDERPEYTAAAAEEFSV